MPIAISISIMIMISFYGIILFQDQKARELSNETGVYNPTTMMIVSPKGAIPSLDDGLKLATLEAGKKERENIETALIRTCRTVSTLAHFNSCANWNKSTVIWNFVGTGTGSLDQVFTGPNTATFGCGAIDSYARGLMQKAIPASVVIGKLYTYDLTTLDDTAADPCGNIDIVGK